MQFRANILRPEQQYSLIVKIKMGFVATVWVRFRRSFIRTNNQFENIWRRTLHVKFTKIDLVGHAHARPPTTFHSSPKSMQVYQSYSKRIVRPTKNTINSWCYVHYHHQNFDYFFSVLVFC